ncbi:hypothetical protein [Paenibacillus thiaminolyticus]|uniref:Uncharacterized protein n=1 Tax=Paenibacillus thiaminolyticus TaxID=49283 RepID=A0A3A3GHG2_PANTH|nr:hypothetical protein [Paenibacillus thiaminolyticus]RJG23302.1 hypothetical protein DQX05_13720 [Paenibacillus thiaminolyticus]RJG23319.1 hypothetical protein DQX05_13810 [Paenibacillus thiaminolyticus]
MMVWLCIGSALALAIGLEMNRIMCIRHDIAQFISFPDKQAVEEYLRKNLQRSIRAAAILAIGFLLVCFFIVLIKNDALSTAQAVLELDL